MRGSSKFREDESKCVGGNKSHGKLCKNERDGAEISC
jgi:hypothetical protein